MKGLLIFALVVMSAITGQAQEISTNDFAAGYYLEIDNLGPVHVLELPPEVYATVRHANLGDIRVFNGAGETVPYGLRHLVEVQEEAGNEEEIPFFPLYQKNQAAGQADLTMQVHRNSSGTIVDINTGGQQDGRDTGITGYLLDLSALRWPIGELEFLWKTGADTSIFTVTLQQSNDLQHWSPLVASATLVDLQHNGQRVERRKVPLTYKPQKYLRLSWQGNGPPLQLTGTRAYAQILQSRMRRQWADLNNGLLQPGEKELAAEYQTTSHLPINSVQILFQENNPMARIAIQSRSDVKAPWRTRCEQVFYSLVLGGSEVRNEPCVFPSTTDQLWRALVREDGAGIAYRRQAPILQLGWTPSELVFIARGAPPFLLAFGSASLQAEKAFSDSQMVLQAAGLAENNKIVGQARLGRRIELGGEKVLRPLPPPQPWKKWFLWSILILGVGLLAGMVRVLLREMQTKAEKRTTEES